MILLFLSWRRPDAQTCGAELRGVRSHPPATDREHPLPCSVDRVASYGCPNQPTRTIDLSAFVS